MKKILLLTVMISVPVMHLVNCSKDSINEPVEGPTLAEKLQEALDNGGAVNDGKGASAAVIMPDGEMWVGVSGISHGTTPITSDMPFGAGSITKNFTAATILQLAEEGEITLEDSLTWQGVW